RLGGLPRFRRAAGEHNGCQGCDDEGPTSAIPTTFAMFTTFIPGHSSSFTRLFSVRGNAEGKASGPGRRQARFIKGDSSLYMIVVASRSGVVDPRAKRGMTP